ncbi:MAG: family 20 glycosylhydrolase, partial [Oscillospiraceae bacterium]|nr:family 20 glycosylhydrolase [Oscillospiraceae bacterium]
MLKITSNCEFDSMKICELFFRLMSVWHNIGEDIINSEITMIHDDSLPEEGFRIQSDGCNVKVSGNGRRGISYGMAALANLYDGTRFPVADITESPAMPFRGVQMYMPGINELEGFYRIIDMMVMMRYNTLILEVGGGMEYKKHPEINIGWEKFCKNILAFPGGPNNFQGSDSYWKDSTHTEIGGGSYLPQDTVRNFVDYAKAYGIDIVPELQMFSHAYYITTVYPQFAERAEDHYPDTVCPQNEEAYKLYFELADEVLDVFGCNMVSIGHDEIRVIGKCGLCKDKTGHELLAYEINRLHEFYRSRGVQIAMWCETLQKIESYFTHKFFGGMGSSRTNSFGRVWETPATYDAIKYIPKDILLLDWLYGWSWESQEVAQQYGFKQIFGNFHGEYTRGWNRRKSSPCVIGGETSAWCSSDEYTLGHDGILGDFWFSSMMLWNKDYDEDQYEIYHKKMRKELPRLREVLQHRPSLMSSYKPVKTALIYANSDGENKINRDDLPQIFEQFDLPEEISGIPLGESEVNFNVGMNVDRLLFVHTSLG